MALGKDVQIRWCREPQPEVGAKVCPGTKHALACQTENDYVVVGVHFAAGSVERIMISFDYTQIDVRNVGDVSNSVLRRAIVPEDAKCPPENKFKDVVSLKRTCKPARLECYPAEDTATPGPKDVAVYYMFKRKTWPSVLNLNDIRVETTLAKPAYNEKP